MYLKAPYIIGLLAEEPAEVESFTEQLVEALAPRNSLEAVEAREVAEAYLAGRRLSRFESLGLSSNGFLRAVPMQGPYSDIDLAWRAPLTRRVWA